MVQKAVIYSHISNITFRLSPCTGTSGWSHDFSVVFGLYPVFPGMVQVPSGKPRHNYNMTLVLKQSDFFHFFSFNKHS